MATFTEFVAYIILLTLATAAVIPHKQLSPVRIDFDVVAKSYKDSSGVQNKQMTRLRNSGLKMDLDNAYSMYMATIELGSPSQKVQVTIDTGTLDLWVPGSETLSEYGVFDSAKSNSVDVFQNGTFLISYGDLTGANGDWVRDTIKFGNDITVENATFGYATQKTAMYGVFGVGLRSNEASSWILKVLDNGQHNLTSENVAMVKSTGFYYDNFPILLKNQGYIHRVGYSLYLNCVKCSTGSILFGAIDEAKYLGQMQTLSLLKIDDQGLPVNEPTGFYVELNQMKTGKNKYLNASYPALLDSGSSLIFAPQNVIDQIYSKYGTYSRLYDAMIVDCNSTGEDFVFQFQGKDITVPYEDLLLNFKLLNNKCMLGIRNSNTSYFILGDVFLRSAYVYYDLENENIKIAQAKYTTDSNVKMVH